MKYPDFHDSEVKKSATMVIASNGDFYKFQQPQED